MTLIKGLASRHLLVLCFFIGTFSSIYSQQYTLAAIDVDNSRCEADNLFAFANNKAKECAIAASELTKLAEKRGLLYRVVGGILGVIGLLAIIVKFPITMKSEEFKEKFEQVLSYVSAIVLVGVSCLNIFFRPVSPEHIKNYSKYIRKHSSNITMLSLNPSLDQERKKYELYQACKRADENLQDAYNIWEKIETKTRSRLDSTVSFVSGKD
ncbi:hypothetical protein [Aquimarina macrocephali]|uniref:hypothetical protein n=1 Tax=Aquimarina macrocephali TaxID=666563 RepID=UPI00046326B5|nr:hypothetical protein [Aquimarina macrocephali]